jgi:membrane protein YdbS with pleckstrin-like domain
MYRLLSRKVREIPANFSSNYYIYVPNLAVALVALVLWTAILIGIIYRSWRYKVYYLTILVVGLLSILRHVVPLTQWRQSATL